MIQSYISNILNLQTNSSPVTFQTDCIRTNSCNCNNCRSWLCHNNGSAGYNIVEGGLYEIDFDVTASSATAGVVAFQLYNNGEPISGTLMAETVTAVNDYVNMGINKKIRVCCKGNANITVQAVPTVPTADAPTTPITTQVPIILSSNFSITRLNG